MIQRLGSKTSDNARSVVMLTPDLQIDRRILQQADSLETAGWDVTIIAMSLDSKADDDQRVLRIESQNSEAKRENLILNAQRWARTHLPMNGRATRLIKRLARRYLFDQELFYTRLFHSTVSRYAPSVFIANDLPMLPVAKHVAAACGARLVYDSHELYCEQEFSDREKKRWVAIEAKYVVSCDAVITVNQSIATELESRYGLADVRVICNAACTPSSPTRSRSLHRIFDLSVEKKILLLQGGLSAGRNLEVLVAAMHHVNNRSVVLVILGDGFLTKKLKDIARSKRLTGRVFFHPAVSQNDLLALTATADAGVIPYQATCLNNYYCTPNKMFEFIAAGIPILASDLPEIRNVVIGQRIGSVGDMSTTRKVAALIDDFFADKQRFDEWRQNLVETRKQICWEEEGKKFVKILEDLV